MQLSEFAWYLAAPAEFEVDGRVLRRGGADGEAVASIAGMDGEPWVAVLGLHDPRVTARVWCTSEAQAIEVAEKWLEAMIAKQ